MARLFMGRKTSGGGGAVKVMKNNADDPNTTPSTAVDKFLFDSEVQDLGYAQVTFNLAPGAGNGYYPAGTSESTYSIKKSDNDTGGKLFEIYPGRILPGYAFPLFMDIRCRNPSTGRYRFYDYWGEFSGSESNYGVYGFSYSGNAFAHFEGGEWKALLQTGDRTATVQVNDCDNFLALIWNIPADETAFTAPSASPVSGQKNVLISPTIVKVARPGFDVATASGRQLIADSDHIPAKLIRSGSIASIASGGSVDIALGMAVPSDTFVDAQFSQASLADFSIPGVSTVDGSWDERVQDVEYAFVSGNTVLRIYNRGSFAVKGRYLVFGCGDGQSSGSCPVLQRVAGNPDYIQLVRPGAAEPPHWDDILVDTRVSYLPLIANDYVPIGSFSDVTDPTENNLYGEKRYSVTVPLPAGMVPYVKALCHRAYDTGNGLFHEWRPPIYARAWNGLSLGQNERHWRNTPIVISGNTVKFYLSTSGRAGYNTAGYSDTNYVGYRYYIFAVPDAL